MSDWFPRSDDEIYCSNEQSLLLSPEELERLADMEQIVEARIKASSERLERLSTEILSRDNSGTKDWEHGGKEICTDPGDKEFMCYATKGERGTYLFSRLVGTYWSTWRVIQIQDEPLRSQLSAQRDQLWKKIGDILVPKISRVPTTSEPIHGRHLLPARWGARKTGCQSAPQRGADTNRSRKVFVCPICGHPYTKSSLIL